MKRFTVEKEIMRTAPVCYTVGKDGEQVADEWETDYIQCMTTGFTVHVYEEDGVHYNTEFYPVTTDTASWTDNEGDVLEQIKRDFPPTEYQNDEW